ncbi:protein kintoun [Ascaphus truei]|uniref:protein kintoun n=1 Tax=Ascaphus truei TaxID=8439 RepID=UPI003F590E09
MATEAKPEELSLSRQEVQRLSQAFQDPKFRELFADYAQEISHPESRRQYEEEICMMEMERGMDIKFIHPQPGHVLRTSTNGGQRCYLNICSNQFINKPECKPGAGAGGQAGQHWGLPYSLAPGREDLGKAGSKHMIYDVVFHPDTLYMTGKNEKFKEMVDATALEAVAKQFDVKLDQRNVKTLSMKYKGVPQAAVLRKPRPEAMQKAADPGDPLLFPYPYELPNGGDMGKVKNDRDQPKGSTLDQVSGVEGASPPDEEATVPQYTIRHRSYVELQDYRDSRDSVPSPVPKELVITVDLPLLKSAADVNLDITGKQLSLEVQKPAYKLQLKLPYPVDENQGRAQFNKAKRQLVITVVVIQQNILGLLQDQVSEAREDETIGSRSELVDVSVEKRDVCETEGNQCESVSKQCDPRCTLSCDIGDQPDASACETVRAAEEKGHTEQAEAPSPEDEGHTEQAEAPSPEDEGHTEQAEAPSPEDKGHTEQAEAPSPEDKGHTEQAEAPSPEDKGHTDQAEAPSPEDKGHTEQAEAPSPEDKGLTEQAEAPSPEDKGLTEQAEAPSPEDKGHTEQAEAPSPEDKGHTEQAEAEAPSPEDKGHTEQAEAPSPEDKGHTEQAEAPSPEDKGHTEQAEAEAPSPEESLPDLQGKCCVELTVAGDANQDALMCPSFTCTQDTTSLTLIAHVPGIEEISIKAEVGANQYQISFCSKDPNVSYVLLVQFLPPDNLNRNELSLSVTKNNAVIGLTKSPESFGLWKKLYFGVNNKCLQERRFVSEENVREFLEGRPQPVSVSQDQPYVEVLEITDRRSHIRITAREEDDRVVLQQPCTDPAEMKTGISTQSVKGIPADSAIREDTAAKDKLQKAPASDDTTSGKEQTFDSGEKPESISDTAESTREGQLGDSEAAVKRDKSIGSSGVKNKVLSFKEKVEIIQENELDEDDTPDGVGHTQSTTSNRDGPAQVLKEISREDGSVHVITDHTTHCAFTFQNSLLFDLD